MGKKRKTRQEKIILQLKRKLALQKAKEVPLSTKLQFRQEAISYKPNNQANTESTSKKTDRTVFSYDLMLVKKDILKTIILFLAIVSFQLVLYLKLR